MANTLSVIGTVISAIAVLIAVLTFNKNSKKDDTEHTAEYTKVFTRVETKIDGMGSQITEVRDDVKAQGVLYGDMRERVRAVEESTKSAHHRIDKLEGIENK